MHFMCFAIFFFHLSIHFFLHALFFMHFKCFSWCFFQEPFLPFLTFFIFFLGFFFLLYFLVRALDTAILFVLASAFADFRNFVRPFASFFSDCFAFFSSFINLASAFFFSA